jgi:hypothetical protein
LKTAAVYTVVHALRLSALVNLQTQPLNGIFLSGHHNFPIQCQFPRTRQPLYLKLQTNQQMWSPHIILIPPTAPSTLPAPHLANSARSPGSPASAPRPPRRATGARGGGRARRSTPVRAPAELPAPSPRAEVKRSRRWTATRGRDWGGRVEEELAASSRRRRRLVFSPALRFLRRLAPHPPLLCLAPSRGSSGSSHGGGARFPFLSGGASLSSGGLGSSSPPRDA